MSDARLRRIRPIDREEDDLDPADQVLERHIADAATFLRNAAIDRIVELAPHHEIMAWRHGVDVGVIEETVVLKVEGEIAHPVGQRLAPAPDGLSVVVIDEVFDALPLDRDAVDDQDTVLHLDTIAGQPYDSLDVVGRS